MSNNSSTINTFLASRPDIASFLGGSTKPVNVIITVSGQDHISFSVNSIPVPSPVPIPVINALANSEIANLLDSLDFSSPVSSRVPTPVPTELVNPEIADLLDISSAY